jgi:hypothetical protein
MAHLRLQLLSVHEGEVRQATAELLGLRRGRSTMDHTRPSSASCVCSTTPSAETSYMSQTYCIQTATTTTYSTAFEFLVLFLMIMVNPSDRSLYDERDRDAGLG